MMSYEPDVQSAVRRPRWLSIVIVAVTLFNVASFLGQLIAPLFPYQRHPLHISLTALVAALSVMTGIGLWRMRKWGVWSFVGTLGLVFGLGLPLTLYLEPALVQSSLYWLNVGLALVLDGVIGVGLWRLWRRGAFS